MELVRFFFESIDDDGTNVDIFALIHYPDSIENRNELTRQIEDAIYSYCDSVEDWQFEDLVEDVLKSFNIEFRIVSPITICI